MDIHMAISDLQTDIPPRESLWIKGHQDTNGYTSGLTSDAVLNCEADQLADSFYRDNSSFLPPPPTVTLYHRNIPITWATGRFLRQLHGEDKLRQYIMDKEYHAHWTPETFDSIAWLSYQSALKKLPDFQQTRIIKFSHGWSATGYRLNLINNAEQDRCPNCPRSNRLPSPYVEKENHILRCIHPKLTELHNKGLLALDQTLERLDTPVDLSTAIIHSLTSWFDNDSSYGPEPAVEWPPPTFQYLEAHAHIQAAFEEQCVIGWDEFLRGRISTKWGSIIQDFYTKTNAKENRNRMAWEVTVIKSTWNIFLSCWQLRNNLKHGADDNENKKI